MNEIVYVDNTPFLGTVNSGRAATIAKDGSGNVQVNDYLTYAVRWSPYGDKLALTADFPSDGLVHITALDGSSPVALNPTSPSAGAWLPGGDFSPDQTRFAIGLGTAALADPTHRAGITIFPLDGSASTFIDLGILSQGTITGGSGSCQSVLWLPDGRFAYLAKALSGSGEQEIRTCNADGSEITTIFSDSEHTVENDWWGLCDTYADGSLLIMYTPQDSGAGQLIKCDASGGSQIVLYDDPAGTLIGNFIETAAAISTDETTIAVVCNDSTLRTMPAAGGALTTIGTARRPAASVGWKGAPPIPAKSTIVAGPHTTGLLRLS